MEGPILTVVPGSVAYPPDLWCPYPSHTRELAVVLREKGKSCLVYFPRDIDRTLWRSGHTDLSRLLRSPIRWVAGQGKPVTIAGDGFIESSAWETQAGFAIHVLNDTNPAAHWGCIREFYPIGEQRVRMRLPGGRKVSRVELLRAATEAPFQVANGAITFTIPKVDDYEVAAVYSPYPASG